MEYIRHLRQKIGQSLVLLIGDTVLGVADDNRLLPMKCMDSGCWRLPDGAWVSEEVVEKAAVQLVWEEIGPDVRELVFHG